MEYSEEIKKLIQSPDELLKRKPFTRGGDTTYDRYDGKSVYIGGGTVEAQIPRYKANIISQEQYLKELDPNCHDVLFDENIPALCVKVGKNDYRDVKYEKMSVSFQKNILDKKVLHLTGNPMQFTLMDRNPTEKQKTDFITFKQYWSLRNQDGMRNKMIETQLSCGDAGLLYYFNYRGEIKSRLISFTDGYVICTHKDQNGDTILETIYYESDGVRYIDSYDDTFMYRYTDSSDVPQENGEPYAVKENGWVLHAPVAHGFSEIPLITHRGAVAWENAQKIITSYEILYNIFNALQKRLGWGMLYIKGRFKRNAEKIAGSVILNDDSLDGNGDAKFLTPPTPDNIIKTLELMEDTIQKSSSTTFILPKDLSMSGDISGIAVQMTQSMDIESALKSAMEWQNVADKMTRLFKEGLSHELVQKGKEKNAKTDFENINVNAFIKYWKPISDTEYNNMLIALVNGGIISKTTGIESNTESNPDELYRIKKEDEEARAIESAQAQQSQSMQTTDTSTDDNSTK